MIDAASILAASEPIRVEITQPKPTTDWVESLSHYAWPLAVLVILLVYRKSLAGFLSVVGQRASEINIGSWASFKLPVLTESPIDEDVAQFKQVEGTQLSESYKTELFRQFRSPGKSEYAVVNLGAGKEWISSRLFIFAVMLQRMKSLKCMVFVYDTDQLKKIYLGCAGIDNVRWSFAARQPWLEAAFAKAYSEKLPIPPLLTPFDWITSDEGALSPDNAEAIVRRYVEILLESPPAAETPNWVKIGNTFEHATWVTADGIVQTLGRHLMRESVVKLEDKKTNATAILKCSGPYVAMTSENGEFASLINRAELLEKVARKVSL